MSDRIKDKIAKLLKKAESAKEINSLEEAELFAEKANQLLMEHNLSLSDIEMEDKSQAIDGFTLDTESIKTEGDWVIRLYTVISKYNLCKVIVYKNSTKIVIFGSKDNVDMVMYICSHLRELIKKSLSERWKAYEGPEKKGTFKRGYLTGAVIGINSKLAEQHARMQKEVEGVTTLVRTNEVALSNKVGEWFPILGKARQKSLKSSAGMTQGIADGKNMNISKAIN